MSWSSGEPAPLDEETARQLIQAAEREVLTRRTPQEQLLSDLMERYPFRMRRILADMRWLEKKARKRGITFK